MYLIRSVLKLINIIYIHKNSISLTYLNSKLTSSPYLIKSRILNIKTILSILTEKQRWKI